MSEKKPLSVEEILAACRRADGAGQADDSSSASEPADGGEQAAASAPATPSQNAPSPKSPPQKAVASGKKPGEMSVEEMLAAARAEKSSGGSAGGGSAPEPPAEAAQGEAASAQAAAGPSKPASEMSVADILAAARGEKSTPAAASKSAAPRPAAKAAAAKAAAGKPAAGKPAAGKPAAGKASAGKAAAGKAAAGAAAKQPLDTSSILAAARAGTKPGPMTKAQAAAAGKSVPQPAKAALAAPPMPAKPAYAKPKPASETDSTRRGFFATLFGSFLALGFTAFGLVNLLGLLGMARFFFPNVLIEPPNQFKVGFPSDFAPGSVDTRFKAQYGIWVVNADYEGMPMIVALKSVCTHLGCTPNWLEAEQKFKCPCHGSGFYKDGINFEGPAPRPLERYAIHVADDGQLEVDKSFTFQQEMGQWNDPQSFVPV